MIFFFNELQKFAFFFLDSCFSCYGIIYHHSGKLNFKRIPEQQIIIQCHLKCWTKHTPDRMNGTISSSILGHSVETNLKYYSFAEKNNINDLRERLNNQEVHPKSTQNIVFFDKEKSPKASSFKAFN